MIFNIIYRLFTSKLLFRKSPVVIIKIWLVCFLLPINALEPLDEKIMGSVSAQGGVYLSGDISFNEAGGPLNESDDGNPAYWDEDCSNSMAVACGARLALRTGKNQGWLILDNIRGSFSFEGLTLKTRHIDSEFNGDGELFDDDVLEIGLPNSVEYRNVNFTLATSNVARATDSGATQNNILNILIDGDVTMQGNLLIFPTGNP